MLYRRDCLLGEWGLEFDVQVIFHFLARTFQVQYRYVPYSGIGWGRDSLDRSPDWKYANDRNPSQ
jgi:hypothetical protein